MFGYAVRRPCTFPYARSQPVPRLLADLDVVHGAVAADAGPHEFDKLGAQLARAVASAKELRRRTALADEALRSEEEAAAEERKVHSLRSGSMVG